MFKNNQLLMDNLPSVKEIEFTPIHRKYKTISIISAIILGMFLTSLLIVWLWIISDINQNVLIGVITAIAAFIVCYIIIIIVSFTKKAFAIREQDISYKSGFLGNVIQTMPYNRIQHVVMRQSFIEKAFKLHKLQLFGPGGSNLLIIPGLTEEQARQMQQLVVDKMNYHHKNNMINTIVTANYDCNDEFPGAIV